jgi:hypothetical protein
MTPRKTIFLILCLSCATVAVGYFLYALHRSEPMLPTPGNVASKPPPSSPTKLKKTAPPTTLQRLLFTSTDRAHRGSLASQPLKSSDPSAIEFYDRMDCLRIDYRGHHGICLRINTKTPGFPTDAVLFDRHFQTKHVIAVDGIVSRARVSPDGRWGAVTVFKKGDSYADARMSTRTKLIDMDQGTPVADLEEFSVWQDSQPFHKQDFNFWGVTFENDNHHFYATLGTGGKTYLIRGDRLTRKAQVITEGVECPSLSPDNTRLAFKKRNPPTSATTWHLAVLELATLKEVDLSETRNIDQQVQWLDNQHILYALSEDEKVIGGGAIDSWIIPADNSGPPKRLFVNTDSPVAYGGS